VPGKLTAMRIRLITTSAAATLALAGCASAPAATTSANRTQLAPRPGHVARLAAGGQRDAGLTVLSGAASVTVSAATMPGTLVRAWTPASSGVRPELVLVNGTVQLYLASTGQGGPDAVLIQLSSAVRWQLQLSGGASQTSVQMGNGKLSGLDFTAGSSVITTALPRPAGTVTITLAGGASQLTIAVPAGVPARLQLVGGASQATLGGRTYTGIAGGTVLAMPGWSAAASRYDLDATSGVSEVSVVTER
jgi:hypothetical protein